MMKQALRLKEHVLALVLFVGVLPITSRAEPPQTPDLTGAERIILISGTVGSARDRIVGGGITLADSVSTKRNVDATGNEIFWQQYRMSDDGAMRHIFYRQYYRDSAGREAALVGGYMTVHFRNGSLTSVLGTQFHTVRGR